MENDPEPAVVQEDTLVTRLAASSSVMEAEGGLTPRRRSARISRRLSGSEAPTSSPALTPSRSSRASKKTSQNLASKAISKAKVVADTIAEEVDIPPQSQEEPSSEKVENTNVNTPASEPDTKTLTKAPDSTSSEEMSADPSKEATSGDRRETEESSDGTVTSQTVPEGETIQPNTDKQSPADGEETPDSSALQPVPEDKPSVAADAPSPTPVVKNTEPKEVEKSVDKENNSLESPTAQKRSVLDSSEKSEEARSPPKKMLLEKYNEENATVENSTPEVVKTTEKMGQVTTKKVEATPKTKNPVVDRRAAHKEAMSRGRIKSGRFWKAPRDRFKSVVKSKEHRVDAKRRMEMKAEKLRVREMAKALEEDKKREAAEKRARREENEKRRDENARKNEVVQQIKNPAKIKRMKKKQLRMLAKRDTTKVQKS